MHALQHFAVHHGWLHTMILDNGKSFVRTEKEFKKLVQEGRNRIEEFSVLHRLRWIFTIPLSPHQGGIYESLIKRTRRTLKAIVSSPSLSWNEMSTLKCLINSRALGYPSNDPSDLQALSPNHIIVLRHVALTFVLKPSGKITVTAKLYRSMSEPIDNLKVKAYALRLIYGRSYCFKNSWANKFGSGLEAAYISRE